MRKPLIVYYSRKGENYWDGQIRSLPKGNTEVVAEMIADMTGGDLFEIDTVQPYAAGYRDCVQQAVAEFRQNARPALKAYPDSLDGYDVIFVGYPNWCGTMPTAVSTFLTETPFRNVTIHPLCTSGGSGMANSEADIQKLCPVAVLRPGLLVAAKATRAPETEAAIRKWVAEG